MNPEDRNADRRAQHDVAGGDSSGGLRASGVEGAGRLPEEALRGIASIRDLPIENKKLFLRVDFNVPLDEARKITDDSRIREALPTIKHAMERGARLVIASHMGRPKGGPSKDLSLEPCGDRLAELLGVDVLLPEDCIGDAPKKLIHELRAGQVVLLENLRFHKEEEKDDEGFAKELASLAEVYVDDAFGAVHRAHASVHAVAKLFRDRGCGFLLEREIAALGKLVTAPDKPYVAVLGGAKVSDKIAVIESLLQRVDHLLIGGAMSNTFLAAKGVNVQASKIESDKLALARSLLEKAAEKKVELLLPEDVVVAKSLDAADGRVVEASAIPEGHMALDIGPRSVAKFAARFAGAKTIFWNGPMGLFEKAPFASGTFGVAKAMAECGAFTVVGGGDSAAAVHAAPGDVASKMSHISTGGGASLELIEGKKLPGIEVLRT
jgi:phosphoglycerate kinase